MQKIRFNRNQCLWPIFLFGFIVLALGVLSSIASGSDEFVGGQSSTPILITPKIRPLTLVPEIPVKNEDKKLVYLSSLKKESEVLALVFVSSSCPATSLYWDRIKGIWYNYRNQNVRMFTVGGNSDDSLEELRSSLNRRDLEIPILWDHEHVLAKKAGIEYTPHALVIGRNWEVLYRGWIDDAWRDEKNVQQRYLENAITAAISGKKSPDHIDELFMGSRMR